MPKANKKKVTKATNEKEPVEETIGHLLQLNHLQQVLLNKLQKQVRGRKDEREKTSSKERLLSSGGFVRGLAAVSRPEQRLQPVCGRGIFSMDDPDRRAKRKNQKSLIFDGHKIRHQVDQKTTQ